MEESKVLFEGSDEEKTTQGETTESQESMEDLLEKEGDIDFPKIGDTRTGVIASISDTEILVSIGAKSEGIIGWREFEQIDPKIRSELKIGQEIPVFILRLEDRNGNLVLSYTRAREEMDWDFAEKLLETEDSYDGKVIGFNKGGLLVGMGQLRGFVPASQIGLSRRISISGDTPEKRYGEIMGEIITVRVIEVDRARRRLILSERMALKETRESLKDQLLDDLNIGDVRTGRVTSLADFGAFVNIDGADGLVHLSEISWERIQSPKEVLKVGQDVKVEVISIDRERKRIGLSIRRQQDNPWLKKIAHLQEGQLIQGTITHLTKFGAFAKLGEDDLEGLIHVSEISSSRIEHPKEVISEGDTLTLRVIKIDKERQRIGLSIRKVDSAAYADLDWKMLRDEIDAVSDGEDILDIEEFEESQGDEITAIEEAEVTTEQLTVDDNPVVEEEEKSAPAEVIEQEEDTDETVVTEIESEDETTTGEDPDNPDLDKAEESPPADEVVAEDEPEPDEGKVPEETQS
jgi:small subunit ribosomal protein S1